MAVKLNYTIQASNFEAVRDRIASILKEEMDNQALLRGTPQVSPLPNIPNPDYTANFFTERFTPVGKEEGNVITVDLDGGSLDNQTPITQSFECRFNIDIFTGAKHTTTGEGYYNSAIKLHRLAGLVRHILQSPYYDRLSFADGIIERRSVSQIQFAKVNDEQDSTHTRMARITFTVRMNESSNQITPTTAGGYDTIIKIAETELGYLLTYNNE
jgi:hypothetical protein